MGIFSSVIAIVELFCDLPQWFRYIWVCCVAIFIFIVIINLVIWIKQNFSIKKELTFQHAQHLKCISEKLHICFHIIKDYIGYDKDDLSNRKAFSDICKNICNNIEKVFAELWDDQNVSVCMKKIIVNSEKDCVEDWEVKTIARSSNAKQNRRQTDNKSYRIIENKDFYVIASPKYKDSFFSSPNMEKVDSDFLDQYGITYRNTTFNYLDYYKSTIVVPIRISFDSAHPQIR